MHHFVTAPFELVKQLRKRFGGVLVEVVHQKDTFAALFQLTRHIRVASKQELKDRLMAAVDYFNNDPVVHTWTYKLDKAA